MRVKIGYEMLTFVDLTQEQKKAVEKVANYGVDFYAVPRGFVAKGSKANLFDLLCALAYNYDLEVI